MDTARHTIKRENTGGEGDRPAGVAPPPSSIRPDGKFCNGPLLAAPPATALPRTDAGQDRNHNTHPKMKKYCIIIIGEGACNEGHANCADMRVAAILRDLEAHGHIVRSASIKVDGVLFPILGPRPADSETSVPAAESGDSPAVLSILREVREGVATLLERTDPPKPRRGREKKDGGPPEADAPNPGNESMPDAAEAAESPAPDAPAPGSIPDTQEEPGALPAAA